MEPLGRSLRPYKRYTVWQMVDFNCPIIAQSSHNETNQDQPDYNELIDITPYAMSWKIVFSEQKAMFAA